MGQVDPLVREPKWAGRAWTGKIDLSKGLPCTYIFTGIEEQERGEKGERRKIDLSKAALSNKLTKACNPLYNQHFHWEKEEQERIKGEH